MVGEHKIENTNLADLEFIYGLFDQSILYQEKKGFPVWRNYDKATLLNDVKLGNQYKVTIHGQVAIVFSVCYSDKILWREMETGDSIYPVQRPEIVWPDSGLGRWPRKTKGTQLYTDGHVGGRHYNKKVL